MNALTLFSGLGIDEIYLEQDGIDVVAACELLKSRVQGYKELHKNQQVFNGDITDKQLQDEIVDFSLAHHVNFIIATPPCQGFSRIGKNKSLEHFLKDPRNYLALEAVAIMKRVKPNFMLFENVPQFNEMIYDFDGKKLHPLEYFKAIFGDEYNVKSDIFDAQYFEVPQKRKRVVFRIWKKGEKWADPKLSKKVITLRDAIGNLPSLMPGEASNLKNHFARRHTPNQIIAMQHTPSGQSALKNPIYFPKTEKGVRIKGFGNTYKRMKWDEPANTLTMRNECLSSQDNVHPGRLLENGLYSDPRVLTLREILIVSSLPPDIDVPTCMTETQFRQIIGEGIPPRMLEKIVHGIGKEK